MQQGATARLEKLLENSEAAQESDPTVTQANQRAKFLSLKINFIGGGDRNRTDE